MTEQENNGFGELICLVAYSNGKYEIFDSRNDFSQKTDDFEQAKIWANELIDNFEDGAE